MCSMIYNIGCVFPQDPAIILKMVFSAIIPRHRGDRDGPSHDIGDFHKRESCKNLVKAYV
jgi:hypothetical protein